MFARLSVDTGLLRDYGAACAAHATDLDDVATRLRALGPPPMFGPVGARFVASLLLAVGREAGTLTQLSSSVAGGNTAAQGSAVNYEVADGDTALRITG
jgi:hypothetical protein